MIGWLIIIYNHTKPVQAGCFPRNVSPGHHEAVWKEGLRNLIIQLAALRRVEATPSPLEQAGGTRGDQPVGQWPRYAAASKIAASSCHRAWREPNSYVCTWYQQRRRHGQPVSFGVRVAPSLPASPTTRWGIAADLNSLASQASQRGQPTPAVTTSASGNSTTTATYTRARAERREMGLGRATATRPATRSRWLTSSATSSARWRTWLNNWVK